MPATEIAIPNFLVLVEVKAMDLRDLRVLKALAHDAFVQDQVILNKAHLAVFRSRSRPGLRFLQPLFDLHDELLVLAVGVAHRTLMMETVHLH